MKLFVLSASTGGGHNMRAYALRDWWHEKGGECQVYQPLENTFWGYKSGCQFYNFIQKKMPFLHYGYFNFLELASLHRNQGIIFGSQKFLRKSERIDFVGGIRGLNELSRRVDSGDMAVAFALYPVSMDQLLAIADAGEIMPPKTTWFEPKLRSGLFVHSIKT